MVLDAILLNTQHYKIRIKGKVVQSRELNFGLVAIGKGAFRLSSTTDANFTLLTYMISSIDQVNLWPAWVGIETAIF